MLGPLTKEALEAERKKSQLDPRRPSRPLRHLPVGQIEQDSPEFKAFRKYALDNNVLIQLVANPKIPGKESYKRYERYRLATTLREIIELSATASEPAVRAQQVKKRKKTSSTMHFVVIFYSRNMSTQLQLISLMRGA